MEAPKNTPTVMDWFGEGEIDEVAFFEFFLQKIPLKCINGNFFGLDGLMSDSELEKEIYGMIKAVVTKGIEKGETASRGAAIGSVFRGVTGAVGQNTRENGTYFLDGTFSEKKGFCRNRLPVVYENRHPRLEQWLKFLSELLEEEDIKTLQEYMGYCMIPSNKAQKLLMMLGKGGEGKSRVGLIMRSILGVSMNVSSIQKVKHNRFARTDLEYRLLMVDDDMKMEALKDTNYIKSIVTLEEKMDLERKSQQSVQGTLCVRFMCFGNGTLSSLHDRSYGFYRRQLILTTKEVPADREDNPFLIENLKAEVDDIFLWRLEGFHRLLKNNYKFTVSARDEQNLKEAMEESNNIIAFMKSEGYIQLEEKTMTTSKSLY